MKFRKKQVTIDAVQFLGDNFTEVKNFMGTTPPEISDGNLMIPTLEGPLTARPGDWIIKGVKGEFYPCKPDIFAATYELADSAQQERSRESPGFMEWPDLREYRR